MYGQESAGAGAAVEERERKSEAQVVEPKYIVLYV